MMRPMKLAGEQLLFGEGTLAHLENIEGTKAYIVTSGDILEQTGVLDLIRAHLNKANIKSKTFYDVEPDPSFDTVMKGVKECLAFEPDLIIAVGGGSAMDAAKTMWIYYEHPELKRLTDIVKPNPFPTLRQKARMVCIPSTAGTASEVSRSVVITDNGIKHGIGNMEMMPDIAICDPIVTTSMPLGLTAATGMDALTHAIEAYMSNRANFVSDVLAVAAIKEIFASLVKTMEAPKDIKLREQMLNASMMAGMAFTNVSLGIVHSIAHTIGSYYHVPHGLANAILLPYVIEYNMQDETAKKRYHDLAKETNVLSIIDQVKSMNKALNIPSSFKSLIENEQDFLSKVDEMAALSMKDGCTKTNPIIPPMEDFAHLIKLSYYGKDKH